MKKKMNLQKLSVNSFVTHLKDGKSETVKGGRPPASDTCPEETEGCGSDGCSDICSITCYTHRYILCDQSIGC